MKHEPRRNTQGIRQKEKGTRYKVPVIGWVEKAKPSRDVSGTGNRG